MNAHSDTHVIVKCKRPRKHPRASRPFANQSPTAIPSSKVFLAFVSDCNFKIHRARAPAHLHSNASSCALACLPLRVRKFCVIERRQWIHLAPAFALRRHRAAALAARSPVLHRTAKCACAVILPWLVDEGELATLAALTRPAA